MVSMAIKERPAGSVLCSLRRRMRDKAQLPFQIIFPTANQGSLRMAVFPFEYLANPCHSRRCHHAIKGLGKKQWEEALRAAKSPRSFQRDNQACF